MPVRLIALLLACSVSSAAAQTPSPSRPIPSLRPAPAHAVWAVTATDARAERRREPLGGFLGPGDEDHRYAGFFVGTGLGVLATLYSVALCDQESSCSSTQVLVMGTLVSAMTGLAGAVLGGFVPK